MNPFTPTTLSTVRRAMPRRALSFAEAIAVAEQQANRLATAWGAEDHSIQEADITGLSRIEVERVAPDDGLHSGSSRYERGRWIIQLDSSEPPSRQRFTLAHELKHILDSDRESSYHKLSDQQIERVCDHFAGCLLMSKRAIYRLWGDGLRTPEALATACRVSLAAMKVRLSIMGLPINSGIRTFHACRKRLSAFPPRDQTRTLTPPLTSATASATAPGIAP